MATHGNRGDMVVPNATEVDCSQLDRSRRLSVAAPGPLWASPTCFPDLLSSHTIVIVIAIDCHRLQYRHPRPESVCYFLHEGCPTVRGLIAGGLRGLIPGIFKGKERTHASRHS